jgi:hypothetical protein
LLSVPVHDPLAEIAEQEAFLVIHTELQVEAKAELLTQLWIT